VKFTRLILVLLCFGFVTCNRPPKPCIEMDNNSIAVGSPITFTSCSKRALSFEWFISGPEGAPENFMGWSDPSFSKSFSIPGAYTVTLHAYSRYSFLGQKATETASFNVN